MVIGGIVAGGTGSRMGNYSVPKQFLLLDEKPIVVHVVEKFLSCTGIDAIVVGVHKDWYQYMMDLKKKYFKDISRITVVKGGLDRNGTILEIMKAAEEQYHLTDDDILVTHDAVRPFVSFRIIQDNIEAAKKYHVCDTVVGATDTIVCSENGEYITDIPVRQTMFQGQTPQSFKVGLFKAVYNSMTQEELNVVTDACKMFYLRNHAVYLVTGDVSNIKITYPFDYKMAQIMMESQRDD